ncbi:hypothetical protein G4B88_013479 [Cannabis sativa]|uniref:Reverse transcriptase zinc-binding domain-containing protein n=1 Tax=Cannabis sativa TaxID=3483 RepID=A0A7J6HKY4_CANSA|nr:hypothetical protein G4B88_013479 [Cannabis sativa]
MENLVLQDSIINSRLCWLGLRQTCDSKTQLLTRDKLNRIMPIKDIKCPVCELKDESHDHVMFDCLFSKQLGQVTWPTSITDLCNMCFLARHDLQNRTTPGHHSHEIGPPLQPNKEIEKNPLDKEQHKAYYYYRFLRT